MDDEERWEGGAAKQQPWEKKRRISNYIGVGVLVALLATIGIYKGVEWVKSRNKVSQTEKTLQKLCKGFAKNDKAVIAEWAAGTVKDAWDNQIVLHSDDRTKIVFVSKGPDGVLDTPDDIRSEETRPSARAETQAALKNNEANANIAEIQQKAEAAVDVAKKAAEKGEAQGENGGWKWKFRWGRSKEGD